MLGLKSPVPLLSQHSPGRSIFPSEADHRPLSGGVFNRPSTQVRTQVARRSPAALSVQLAFSVELLAKRASAFVLPCKKTKNALKARAKRPFPNCRRLDDLIQPKKMKIF